MRRLTTPSHVTESERIQHTMEHGKAENPHYYHRSSTAVADHLAKAEGQLWENIPLPSIADPTDSHLLKLKTLLDCCRCAQEFIDEHDLGDGLGAGEIN